MMIGRTGASGSSHFSFVASLLVSQIKRKREKAMLFIQNAIDLASEERQAGSFVD